MDDLGIVERHDIKSRQHWMDLRGPDFTASDIACLYGLGYRSLLQVWAEKTGKIPPRADNPMLRFGRWAEPMIFAALRDKYPMVETRQANIYLRSPSCRIGATPDSISIMRKPIESEDTRVRYLPGYLVINGKLVYRQKFHDEWCEDGQTIYGGITPPLGLAMQVQLEAMLAERYLGEPCTPVLAPLEYDIGFADVHLVPVERRPELETGFVRLVNKFWADTAAGIEPEIDTKKDGEALGLLYPEAYGEIDLRGDNELCALFDEREQLGHVERGAKKRRGEIKTTFQARMGHAAYARLADGRRVSLLPVRETWIEGFMRKAYRTLRLAKKGIG